MFFHRRREEIHSENSTQSIWNAIGRTKERANKQTNERSEKLLRSGNYPIWSRAIVESFSTVASPMKEGGIHSNVSSRKCGFLALIISTDCMPFNFELRSWVFSFHTHFFLRRPKSAVLLDLVIEIKKTNDRFYYETTEQSTIEVKMVSEPQTKAKKSIRSRQANL